MLRQIYAAGVIGRSMTTNAGSRTSPTLWRSRLRASVAIAAMARRSLWTYRAGLVISVGVLLVQIFALQMVWTWVYADQTAVTGSGGAGQIPLTVQLAYVTLSTVQFWALNHWGVYSLQQRVREGRVATDLALTPRTPVASHHGTSRHHRRLPPLRRRRPADRNGPRRRRRTRLSGRTARLRCLSAAGYRHLRSAFTAVGHDLVLVH